MLSVQDVMFEDRVNSLGKPIRVQDMDRGKHRIVAQPMRHDGSEFMQHAKKRALFRFCLDGVAGRFSGGCVALAKADEVGEFQDASPFRIARDVLLNSQPAAREPCRGSAATRAHPRAF